MKTVKSKDGTTIAYDQYGSTGDVVIFVDGALQTRYPNSGMEQIANLLTPQFTVLHHDRRGRGQSSDTKPYAIQREVEDIEALIDSSGGAASLFGVSSGGALAFEAALVLGSKVKKLAMYEAPYNDDPAARQGWVKYSKELNAAIDSGRRGDAVALFMTLVGMPTDQVAGMRHAPMWPGLEAVAPSLAYDAAAMGEESAIPAARAAKLTIPVLLMDGGASYPFMHTAAVTLAKAIPKGQQRTLEGQTHDVSPQVLAPVLIKFFAAK